MNVLLVCGGRSCERDISVQSSQFFIKYLKYNVHILIIDQNNNCELYDHNQKKIDQSMLGAINIIAINETFICEVGNYRFTFDVVLPILHGKFGEDGTIQGWLELLGAPYVGCGVLSSAICLDKDITKRLIKQIGINTADYFTLRKGEHIPHDIHYPVFVKAANSGSSIGVYKIYDHHHLQDAVNNALGYDNKVLVEKAIENAREIEIAVLQGEELIVSIPGEIIVKHDFYSYEAKYENKDAFKLDIPAKLSSKQISYLQRSAKSIFEVLNCSGMARIDFLMQGDDIFFNEVNTIPGFTEISLYPNLLKASGIEYTDLIEILIKSAFRKY